jgi:hypothetical protein
VVVIRDGKETEIDAVFLVPGDILLLSDGRCGASRLKALARGWSIGG